MQEEWGWNPETLAAIGTVASAAAAAFAVMTTMVLAHRTARRDRTRHAALVNFQRDSLGLPREDFNALVAEAGLGSWDTAGVKATVTNHSAAPIGNLKLIVSATKTPKVIGAELVSTHRAGRRMLLGLRHSELQARLGPGESASLLFLLAGDDELPMRSVPDGVGLTFVDIDGRSWTRTVSGRLHEGLGTRSKECRKMSRQQQRSRRHAWQM